MNRRILLLATATILSASATSHAQAPPSPPPPLDGTLTIYISPPTVAMDWTTPNRLVWSAIQANAMAYMLEQTNLVVSGHAIGHVQVEMHCEKNGQRIDIPIIGMTSNQFLQVESVGAGMGALLAHFPGTFDNTATATSDINRRKQSGLVGIMKFPLMWAECVHLMNHKNAFVAAGAHLNYGSQFRPRGFIGNTGAQEGAGCATFVASFIDVADLLPRSYITNTWARQIAIGLSRIGGDPTTTYRYGSNLVAVVGGWFLSWPVGVRVPSSGWIVVGSPWLDSWYSPAEWNASQVVPLTLYDPELWARDLGALHTAAEGGAKNGWYASWDVSAPVITKERGPCPTVTLKPLVDTILDLTK